MSSTPETRGSAPSDRTLVAGVVALEFGATVSELTVMTLLPSVVADPGARDQLALLVAAPLVGGCLALPKAGPVASRLGRDRAFAAGLVLLLAGSVLTAATTGPAVFGAGSFVRGVGGGLLGVFGVTAVVELLGPRARRVLVTLSTAMWVVPSRVGPLAAAGLQQWLGWRPAILLPLPFVLVGRALVARATRGRPSSAGGQPVARALLVPMGAGLVVAGSVVAGQRAT